MNHTITVLYETKAAAEHARDALAAAGLGHDVQILDQDGPEKGWTHLVDSLIDKLLAFLDGDHKEIHTLGEGLRRGHFLLVARVGEFQETRAAEVLDTTASLDVEEAKTAWKGEGWTPGAPA